MPEILIAADAPSVVDEVVAALEGPDTTIRVVRRGQDVVPAVVASAPDVVVADLQIGNMGAMAVTVELHHERDAGRLDHVPVLMLLDRAADTWLAKQAAADAWLVKPLSAFTLRRATEAAIAGTGRFDGYDQAEWPALAAAARGEEPPPPVDAADEPDADDEAASEDADDAAVADEAVEPDGATTA